MRIVSVSDKLMESFQINGFDTVLPVDAACSYDFSRLSIRDLLMEKSRRCGDVPALADDNGTYTWAEVYRRSRIMAGKLAEIGVSKGTHVGLDGKNSVDYIICFYAIQMLGGIAILINSALKPREINSQIETSDVTHLCIGSLPYKIEKEDIECEILNAESTGLKELFFYEGIDWSKEEDNVPSELFNGHIEPDDACIMIFTSGSTGKPKGVMLSAYNVLSASNESRQNQRLTESDVTCNILPLCHIFGLVAGLFSNVLAGSLMILPRDTRAATLIENIYRNSCTVFHAVPTLLMAIIKNETFEPEKLATLRCTIVSGAAASPQQFEVFRKNLPNDHFLSSYGMSELAPITITGYGDSDEYVFKTVGKPISIVELKIRDYKDGHECAVNEIGEILSRGPNLMSGYYKIEAENQPIDEDGWIHTGDLGFIDEEGYVHFSGRLKELIIKAGENIMPADVAQAVATLPQIEDVKVVGVPDEFFGEQVAACITLKHGENFNQEEVEPQMCRMLARFKMPAYYLVFDSFPVLSNGKIDMVSVKEEAERRVKQKSE
jgi:Acyl-CoA synthetases (AMP-forming)/AMP-acid ligases II